VIDNLERAISAETSDPGSILDGVRMISKLFMDILVKQGLEEIEALGGEFDPNFHNAVMHVDDEGHLIVMEKARGRKKSLDALVTHMEETVINPEEQVIFISHGDCLEDAEYVAKQVKEKLNVKDVMVRVLDPVIGAHSGPGTVALFFVGTKR
jgi:hypothetical protein